MDDNLERSAEALGEATDTESSNWLRLEAIGYALLDIAKSLRLIEDHLEKKAAANPMANLIAGVAAMLPSILREKTTGSPATETFDPETFGSAPPVMCPIHGTVLADGGGCPLCDLTENLSPG